MTGAGRTWSVVVTVAVLALAAGWLALELRRRDFGSARVTGLDESSVDPARWGRRFPRQYQGWRRTVDAARTKHGGSEAFSRLEQDPRLGRLFAGHAFEIAWREDRGHAYSLADVDSTGRARRGQSGACLQCHAAAIAAYREAGDGDVELGFERVCGLPYAEARRRVEHPVACIDCHDPRTMRLRITRPAFLDAMRMIKAGEGVANYDPNSMASGREMRSLVCAQCHSEYYLGGPRGVVVHPWGRGFRVDDIEAYYDAIGHRDWTHAETGAPLLKAQHPEFELASQGAHARRGVSCADCHMPSSGEGEARVSDHHVRSPLLGVERACLGCHAPPAAGWRARAESIQDRTRGLLDRAEDALVALIDEVVAARRAGADSAALARALALQRSAQLRADFVHAENSGGFHAPDEAARVLGDAIRLARAGEAEARRVRLRRGGGAVLPSP